MAEPLDNVRDISRIAYGFMASKVLFAALDLDLFGLLARAPKTAGALTRTITAVKRKG
jgi:2-hydroxy-4-(methylsulfanyl)butanoate S-methyltransferase